MTNADLSFHTRRTAEQAPELLRADVDVNIAFAMTARLDGIGLESARTRVREAAQRAGVTEAQLARTSSLFSAFETASSSRSSPGPRAVLDAAGV